MNNASRTAVLLALLSVAVSPAAADEPATTPGGSTTYPRTLKAAELQKLYGREAQVEAHAPNGKLRIEVMPDGGLVGHNESLIGGAAAQFGTSQGKWRVEAETAKLCHEWNNPRWKNTCFMVVETAPGAYEWSPRGEPGGTKFTLQTK